jgi:hypothetical protein
MASLMGDAIIALVPITLSPLLQSVDPDRQPSCPVRSSHECPVQAGCFVNPFLFSFRTIVSPAKHHRKCQCTGKKI